MVRISFALFFSFCFIFAAQVEISADHFFAHEKKGENVLSGNVVVKRDKDILHASKLVVMTNKKRKAVKYIASGNTRFEITLNEKLYKGSGDELTYDVHNDSYEINGNAVIEELTTKKKVSGDKIIIDRKQEMYSVFSNEQKPAKFVFELDEP